MKQKLIELKGEIQNIVADFNTPFLVTNTSK